MQDNEKERQLFFDSIFLLSKNFRFKLDDFDVPFYLNYLNKYDIKQIQNGIDWLILNREATYPAMPIVKEIVEAIEKTSGFTGIKAKSRKQLDIVLNYSKRDGRECKHLFKDSVTRTLMNGMWSMWQLGNMNESDLRWFKKDFIKEYEIMAKEEKTNNPIEHKQEDLKIPAAGLKKLIKKDHLKIVPIKKGPVNKYKAI